MITPDLSQLWQLLKTDPNKMQQDPSGGNPNGNRQIISDSGIDVARPFVANAVGDLAGAAGTVLGGPVGGVAANNAGYALTDTLMQQLKTKKPDFGESLAEGEKEALINAVGGKIMNGLFKIGKGAYSALSNNAVPDAQSILNFKPTASQALESYGWHKLATAGKFAEDFGSSLTGAKDAALDRSGGAGFTQALRLANGLNGRTFNINSDPVKLADKLKGSLAEALEPMESEPLALKSNSKSYQANEAKQYQVNSEAASVLNGGQNPFSKIDDVIQDPDRLSKVLTTAQLNGQAGQNIRKDLQAYQFMRMVNDATTKDVQSQAIRIDPNKLTKTWSDPDMSTSLDTLYGKIGSGTARDNITQFIKNVSDTQSTGKKISYMGGGFAISAAASLLANHLDIPGGYAGGLASFYIPTAVMGSVLSSKSAGKVMAQLAQGVPLSDGNRIAGRLLTDALQGSSIALMDSAGKKTWGSVVRGKDGTLTFQEQGK